MKSGPDYNGFVGFFLQPRVDHFSRLPHQLSGDIPPNKLYKQHSYEARSEPALSRGKCCITCDFKRQVQINGVVIKNVLMTSHSVIYKN